MAFPFSRLAYFIIPLSFLTFLFLGHVKFVKAQAVVCTGLISGTCGTGGQEYCAPPGVTSTYPVCTDKSPSSFVCCTQPAEPPPPPACKDAFQSCDANNPCCGSNVCTGGYCQGAVCNPGAINAGCSGNCGSCTWPKGEYFTQTCVSDGSGWTDPSYSCADSCGGYCTQPKVCTPDVVTGTCTGACINPSTGTACPAGSGVQQTNTCNFDGTNSTTTYTCTSNCSGCPAAPPPPPPPPEPPPSGSPTPTCNSGIVCYGACSAPSNTCSTNNGTRGSCVYTTNNGSTACTQVAAPNQPCTTDTCQSPNTCINGSCQEPTNHCEAAGYYLCTPGTPLEQTCPGPGGQTCTLYSTYACNYNGQNYCNNATCSDPCYGGPGSPPPPAPAPVTCGDWYCDIPNECNGGQNFYVAQSCSNGTYNKTCDPTQCKKTTPAPAPGPAPGPAPAPAPTCATCGGANQACCYGSDAYCGGRDGSRCLPGTGTTCIGGRCQSTGGGGSCLADGGSCTTDSQCCGGDCWVGGGSICRSGGGGGSCSNPRTCVPGDPSKQCCSGFFCNTSRDPFECTSTAGSCVSPPDRCGPAADGRGCCPGSYCFEGPCRERDGQGNCLDRDYNCVCQPKCPDPSTIACGQAMSDGCGGNCDGAIGSKCIQGNCDFTRNKCLLPWIQVEGDVHSNTRIDTPGGP